MNWQNISVFIYFRHDQFIYFKKRKTFFFLETITNCTDTIYITFSRKFELYFPHLSCLYSINYGLSRYILLVAYILMKHFSRSEIISKHLNLYTCFSYCKECDVMQVFHTVAPFQIEPFFEEYGTVARAHKSVIQVGNKEGNRCCMAEHSHTYSTWLARKCAY